MSDSSWQVAAMNVADLPAVYYIERQSPSPWSHQQLTEELTYPRALQLVYHNGANESLAGFLMARLFDNETEILKIATAREFQRRGVASRLLQTFIALAALRGACYFHLELRAQNLPALALYEKYAFEMTGRRPNYYTAPSDDALCLTLSLAQRDVSSLPKL